MVILLEDVLPVEELGISLTTDGCKRAAAGISSGGICALNALAFSRQFWACDQSLRVVCQHPWRAYFLSDSQHTAQTLESFFKAVNDADIVTEPLANQMAAALTIVLSLVPVGTTCVMAALFAETYAYFALKA